MKRVHELRRARGVHAVVDLLDDNQGSFWDGEDRGRDREDAEGAIGEQLCRDRTRGGSERLHELDHHLAARTVEKLDGAYVLLGERTDELEDLGFSMLFAAEPREHSRDVRAVGGEGVLLDVHVSAHGPRFRVEEKHGLECVAHPSTRGRDLPL